MSELSARTSVAGFSADPQVSLTLPARLYTDPAIHELENRAIHYRHWHYVTHASSLREAGSYATGWVADQSVFVIRGSDGIVRGFHNVCRHRAHQLLAEGEGQKPVITCPYHAWAYGTDGRLRTARGSENVAGFDFAAFGLSPVKVETWLGFVFVNLDLESAPLAPQVEALAAEMRRLVPDIEHATKLTETRYEMKANWKTFVENSIECFHCEPSHPSFSRVVDLDTYRVAGTWPIVTHASAVRGANDGTIGARGRVNGRFLYWYLWPTTQFSMTTTRRTFVIGSMRLAGPELLIGTDHVIGFPGETFTAEEIAELAAAGPADITLREDIGICESVQRGLHSLGFTQGRYVSLDPEDHTSELGVHRFHMAVAEALAGAA